MKIVFSILIFMFSLNSFGNNYFVAKEAQDRGEYKKAIGIYIEILKKNSGDYNALLGLAKSFANSGQVEKAIMTFKTIFKIHPYKFDEIFYFSNFLYEKKKFEQGLSFSEALLRLRPNDANALWINGLYYWKLGNIDYAKQHLIKAISIDPKMKYRTDYVSILLEQKEIDFAFNEFQKFIGFNENPYFGFKLIEFLVNNEENEKAIFLLKKYLKSNDSDANARYNLALIHNNQGDWDKSKLLFEYNEKYYGHVDSSLQLAFAIKSKSDYIKKINWILENHPKNQLAHELRVKFYIEKGELEKVEQFYAPLAKLRGRSAENFYFKSWLSAQLGQIELSKDYLKEAKRLPASK